jgi:uncharacterized protein with PIN domain
MKTFFTKIYILVFMALTLFFMVIIWDLTLGELIGIFRHGGDTEQAEIRTPEPKETVETSFKKIVLESDETVRHYLGYRVLEEMKIEGHFHHIDYDMAPDNRSYCVECHGNIPHQKKKEIRAFANMHAAFIECETCHVRLEGDNRTGVFKWYDTATGKIFDSPIIEGVAPGLYHGKVIPFERVDGQPRRLDSQERIDSAEDYLARENTLADEEKKQERKVIHQIVDENPHLCEDCHRADEPLLPFEGLGYSKARINHLVSTEVVGMIRDYTKFYVPEMLHPGVSDSEANDVDAE